MIDRNEPRRIVDHALLMTLTCALLAAACGPKPCEYPGFDALAQRAPDAKPALGGIAISQAEYERYRWWGEKWFRGETLGNERMITDVVGLLNGEVEVPCPGSDDPNCYRTKSVLPYVVAAVDALDGVTGNLFDGNDGDGGPGMTSDLVLRFPKGTRLFGTIDVPEQLHTGLEVEAGQVWPIGVVAVKAPARDQKLPYLVDPAALGAGTPSDPSKLRLGLSCAICHYSLDVDMDGSPDLYSAWSRRVDRGAKHGPVKGGRYRAEETWAVGNQDLHLGWILALSKNPLAGYLLLSGPVGDNRPEAARAWARQIQKQYRSQYKDVMRRVVMGLIAHPLGYADDTPDARHNPTQLPTLYTHRTWPYNIEGSQVAPSDRNNSVWTTGLDFSSLVAATMDRGAKVQKQIPGHTPTPYFDITAEQFAATIVHYSPAALHDARQRARLRDDILGVSDGVPGLLDPSSIVVLRNVSDRLIPKKVVEHPANLRDKRLRSPEDFGPTGKARQNVLGATGIRVRTPPTIRARYGIDKLAAERGFNADEFFNDAVSLMLDSLKPPANHSPLLAQSRPLLARGRDVFEQAGCAHCHRGPFFTDNLIHPWKKIGTRPDHLIFTRELQLGAPEYDPRTGTATKFDIGTALGKLTYDSMGVKTLPLRHLWGTAPYLHDGGVGVALRPDLKAGTDLAKLLGRPPSHKLYGMGAILDTRNRRPEVPYRANAALSLQAMVLESERERVIRANAQDDYTIVGQSKRVSMKSLGVLGSGHDFYVDDKPGGKQVTALVAFLLSLDDNPGDQQNPPLAPECR